MQQGISPKWGIWICAAWALVLALLTIANLLLLSLAVEFYSNEYGMQSRVWLIFGLNVVFGLAFAASTFGLWRQQNWGRLLFLWAIIIWSSFNFITLFIPNLLFSAGRDYTIRELTPNAIRFAAGVFVPLWYLNLPRVKAFFYNNTQ